MNAVLPAEIHCAVEGPQVFPMICIQAVLFDHIQYEQGNRAKLNPRSAIQLKSNSR